jgi:hypothetical protein
MSGTVKFHSEYLNNLFGLEAFFKNDTTSINAIKNLAQNPKKIPNPTVATPYFNRFEIVWINVTYPFKATLAIFSNAMALLLSTLYLERAGHFFSIAGRQLLRRWEQVCASWNAKTPLLMPALNEHLISTWDVYGSKAVAGASVKDAKVHALTFATKEFHLRTKHAVELFFNHLESSRKGWLWNTYYSKGHRKWATCEFRRIYEKGGTTPAVAFLQRYSGKGIIEATAKLYEAFQPDGELLKELSHVQFYGKEGVCRGSSLWFIYLYLKTLGNFDEEKAHLISVAKQFENGASRQAALLQAFYKGHQLLGLKKEKIPAAKISLYELDFGLETANQKVASLKEGIYRVGSYHHSMVYIKNGKEGYLWDPSYGLYEIGTEDLVSWVRKHYYKPGNIDSQVYFEKYNIV